MMMAAGLYHWVFLKGARERWPVVGTLVRFVVQDEFEQRDRFMRENLDAMARKLGEMQARMLQLEALGDRVSGLAGVSSGEVKVAVAPTARGPTRTSPSREPRPPRRQAPWRPILRRKSLFPGRGATPHRR
jgi:hypothetical protein